MSSLPKTLAELLAVAAERIERLEPAQAHAAAGEGALLIDIRSDAAREREGIVPGSLHVPRTVLEWRLDPEGDWRNRHVNAREQRLVVFCDHGYSSVLAAAMLAELGYAGVADVVGGFEAWRKAGLPVARARPRDPEELPGMGPPDPA